jgi:hypothetical protein
MKVIELVISERSDSWIETRQVEDGETLREIMQRHGFQSFEVQGVDPDNALSIRDGMTVRVRIMPEPPGKDFP